MTEQREAQDGPKEDPYLGVRTEIAQSLSPSAFPGDAANLMAVARQNDAPDEILTLLEHLPKDTSFENVQAVIDAIPLHGSLQPGEGPNS